MRRKILLISIIVLFVYSTTSAKSPTYSEIEIKGKTKKIFNKVSLFDSGASKRPFKTERIYGSGGEYSITVSIPGDMKRKNNYMYTDMRFWNDKNRNGKRDKGEEISECHFIMWYPEPDRLFLNVYKGPQYEITSSETDYNYHR